MKLNKVEDLLEDILGVPDSAITEAAGWLEITKFLADAIKTADDILVIDVESDRYEDGHPYIQICYEDDGAMTIEAVSSRFLVPGLSPDAHHTLLELGWQLTDDEGSPNYFQFLHAEDANSEQLAQLFTKTFRDVYGVRSTDLFDISPQLVMDKIKKTKIKKSLRGIYEN
jgi:hypothetical protein